MLSKISEKSISDEDEEAYQSQDAREENEKQVRYLLDDDNDGDDEKRPRGEEGESLAP